MNENVQVLMLAKELIESGRSYFICLAVNLAYKDITKKTMQDSHPILIAIKRGLSEAYTLGGWLENNVPNYTPRSWEAPELVLCRMAWIDKLIEEFS